MKINKIIILLGKKWLFWLCCRLDRKHEDDNAEKKKSQKNGLFFIETFLNLGDFG